MRDPRSGMCLVVKSNPSGRGPSTSHHGRRAPCHFVEKASCEINNAEMAFSDRRSDSLSSLAPYVDSKASRSDTQGRSEGATQTAMIMYQEQHRTLSKHKRRRRRPTRRAWTSRLHNARSVTTACARAKGSHPPVPAVCFSLPPRGRRALITTPAGPRPTVRRSL